MSFFTKTALPGLLALLLGAQASAQQTTPPETRPYIVSPVVGEVIDRQEKATYGLFPYYAADNFLEARFVQALSPDSAITLRATLRDGRTALRPFSATEIAALRTTIETRQRELATMQQPAAAADSIGRRYRVTLRASSSFDGELTARRPQQLEFMTKDLGVVQVDRANIMRMEDLTTELARRPASWYDIGNGNRLFFAPTARNLRKGEGSLQDINVYVIGANYGITDNLSLGLMTSVIPGVPLRYQFVALTPKISARISEKWHAGAGLLYLRIPDFGNDGAFGVGLAYGVATYGSADNNLTVGLGYGFAGGEIGATPVLQVGGQTRVSRRVSLISENYIIANSEAGMGGLYGAKINWRRTSLGLGAGYALAFDYAGETGGVISSYILPIYYDFTFRFGKGRR